MCWIRSIYLSFFCFSFVDPMLWYCGVRVGGGVGRGRGFRGKSHCIYKISFFFWYIYIGDAIPLGENPGDIDRSWIFNFRCYSFMYVLSWCWEFLAYPYFCIANGYFAYCDHSFILIWDGLRGYSTSEMHKTRFCDLCRWFDSYISLTDHVKRSCWKVYMFLVILILCWSGNGYFHLFPNFDRGNKLPRCIFHTCFSFLSIYWRGGPWKIIEILQIEVILYWNDIELEIAFTFIIHLL